jgi:hypothetical protein
VGHATSFRSLYCNTDTIAIAPIGRTELSGILAVISDGAIVRITYRWLGARFDEGPGMSDGMTQLWCRGSGPIMEQTDTVVNLYRVDSPRLAAKISFCSGV